MRLSIQRIKVYVMIIRIFFELIPRLLLLITRFNRWINPLFGTLLNLHLRFKHLLIFIFHHGPSKGIRCVFENWQFTRSYSFLYRFCKSSITCFHGTISDIFVTSSMDVTLIIIGCERPWAIWIVCFCHMIPDIVVPVEKILFLIFVHF